MDTVEVVVFGIGDEVPDGSCSCGGAYGTTADVTMREMWDELTSFFQKSSVSE